MTNMGSIIGYKIDYNGVGVRRGQRHPTYTAKIDPSTPPGGLMTTLQKKDCDRQVSQYGSHDNFFRPCDPLF